MGTKLYLQVNEQLISEFEYLLDRESQPGRQKEQEVQDFLESHTEMLPTPGLLNHGLSMGSIISKFPLSKALTTDYVYLTKSSGSWIIHLVELEQPGKTIFNADMDTPTYSASFNAAVAQINSWKRHIDDYKHQILNDLSSLMMPTGMRDNPVSFCYHLIIGRSKNKNASVDRKKQFEQTRRELDINIFTYDSVIQLYRTERRYPKSVMSASKKRFLFKSLVSKPQGIFCYLGPDIISLNVDQELALSEQGYQIDRWKSGELLVVNDKWSLQSDEGKIPFGLTRSERNERSNAD
ncbi:hypothetical protein QE432_005408 [Agrobacterium sp. SORGH_AS 745]|nr:hypothetical protein [Agrobacterium tumefaciens]MDQ1223780.1 hypothetical protein [Agrobacterium sp. SORGH_AS_0745]